MEAWLGLCHQVNAAKLHHGLGWHVLRTVSSQPTWPEVGQGLRHEEQNPDDFTKAETLPQVGAAKCRQRRQSFTFLLSFR